MLSFCRRPVRLLAVLAAGLGLLLSLAAAAGARAADWGGTWGKAKMVPGTAALNTGGTAQIRSVSCASAGNCAAGGSYLDSSRHQQVFVVNKTSGVWGKAKEVPGTAALNTGGTAYIRSVSCGAAGNCAAGGYYTDSSGHQHAFVVNETNGVWSKAKEVAAALGMDRSLDSVSCASAGNCGAGGSYSDSSDHVHAFVVNETNGVWGNAKEVAAALNKGGFGFVNSVSCPSAGSCAAGGGYDDGSGGEQAFVISETRGTWGRAHEVAAALNTVGIAEVESVSCASAGNCGAGGYYTAEVQQVFVINEVNGVWGKAQKIPGLAALNTGPEAFTHSVSCASAGSCAAGGQYTIDNQGSIRAFIVAETNGVWGKAKRAAAALDTDDGGITTSVSCGAAGNCAAGGVYANRSGEQAFVVNEVNGVWGKAGEVPGTAALNTGGLAAVFSVSCASARSCSAGGYYTDNSGHRQAFIVNKT